MKKRRMEGKRAGIRPLHRASQVTATIGQHAFINGSVILPGIYMENVANTIRNLLGNFVSSEE